MVRKTILHWSVALILIAISSVVGGWLDEQAIWITWRYQVYQALQATNTRQPEVTRTALVLVTDEEYWQGEPAHRSPLKRDYLANLILALEKAEPAVIAIDFDLRSPTQEEGLTDHKDYRLENLKLFEAVRSVSQNYPVVLPASINLNKNNDYFVERSIYSSFDFRDGWVAQGYIELPDDLRGVPIPMPTATGKLIDSLASAVVRFENKALHLQIAQLANNTVETLPFGSFIQASSFPVYSTTHVLTADQRTLREELGHKVILIGAGWSRLAYGRGGTVDATMTPIGEVGKVFLHANYIEALLDRRTYSAPSDWFVNAIEISFALALAWLFSRKHRALIKFSIFASLMLVLPVLTYILLQNVGFYFDFFIPLVLLGGHAGVEQILEWRGRAQGAA